MDVTRLASTVVSGQMAGDAAGLPSLKKALNIQGEGAAESLGALPAPPSSSNLPPHLGQNVNTTA